MPTTNPHSLSFGAGLLTVLTLGNEYVGSANLVSGFESSPSGETIRTEGGALQYASAARSGRAPGQATFTLRENPDWLDDIVRGVDGSAVAPVAGTERRNARAFTVESVMDISGADTNVAPALANRVPAANEPQAAPGIIRGRIFIDGKAGGMADIRIASNVAMVDLGLVSIGNAGETEIHVNDLGFTLTIGSAVADGTQLVVQFSSSHGGGKQWRVGAFDRNIDEHRLVIHSSIGGRGDAIYEWIYNRVFINGGKDMTSDNEANQNGGVEFTADILAPENEPPYHLTKLTRAAA